MPHTYLTHAYLTHTSEGGQADSGRRHGVSLLIPSITLLLTHTHTYIYTYIIPAGGQAGSGRRHGVHVPEGQRRGRGQLAGRGRPARAG
jgi:hypothetical protein